MTISIKKICYSILSIYLILSVKAYSTPQIIPLNSMPYEKFKQEHQCQKTFSYEVYLTGARIGNFKRVTTWKHDNNQSIGVTRSSGEISIFWIGSNYKQSNSMIWSTENQYLLTQRFTQKVKGIKAREMITTMSESGRKAMVSLDGEIHHYESKESPLYDIDTFGAQIRINLLKQKKHFTLYRQATDKIKIYKFEVGKLEKLRTDEWGEISAFRINEVGEFSKMVLWFSPELDYQLVQAQLDAFISPMVFLTGFNKECA